MKLLDGLRDYIAHENPANALINLVAVVVALNGPFYPIYAMALIGWDGLASLATMIASPLFFAIPYLGRRCPAAARGALPLLGTVDAVWSIKLFGPESAAQLFCLPCIMLAALLYRAEERWIGLGLIGLAMLPLLAPGIFGAPFVLLRPDEAAHLAALNAGCVAALMGLLAIRFAKLLALTKP